MLRQYPRRQRLTAKVKVALSTNHQARLLELLDRHAAADAAEQAHLDAIRAFVSREPACFSRTTWSPGHITGSAFVIDPVRGQLLLHHHRKLDRWLQMGGHDNGELDAAETAMREAREESGLAQLAWPAGERRILDVDVHVIPARRDEPAHQHLDVRFAILADAAQPLAMDAAESHALAWFSLDEAASRMNEPGAVRVVAKLKAAIARGAL